MEVEQSKSSDSPLSVGSSGARNRFAVLDSVMENKEESLEDEVGVVSEKGAVGVRKSRAAAAGVADLMRTLKPRKKR